MSTAANTSSGAMKANLCQTYCCSRRLLQKVVYKGGSYLSAQDLRPALPLSASSTDTCIVRWCMGTFISRTAIDHATILHICLQLYHLPRAHPQNPAQADDHMARISYARNRIHFALRARVHIRCRQTLQHDCERLALILVVLVNHLLADEITRCYGPKDKSQTTVRVQAKYGSYYTKLILRFYSLLSVLSAG